MVTRTTLIVDDDLSSLQTSIATLEDAQRAYLVVDSNEAAMAAIEADPAMLLVLLRGAGKQIRGAELCRSIRSIRSREELSVIVILQDSELSQGAEMLIAGASDLLIAPFEPRELRMRGRIVPADQVRRVDRPHTLEELHGGNVAEPELFVPEFDPQSNRFTFGRYENRVAKWESDPDTKRIPLDRVIVCPECEAVPTVRPGCGSCGSAWVQNESLIHHYACAHVGPETEFRTSNGLSCPKCRLPDLVAGSDFDQVKGCLKCSDCNAVSAKPEMICHCLSCHHRFPASEGKVQEIYGYQVGVSPYSAKIGAPNFQTLEARTNSLVSE